MRANLTTMTTLLWLGAVLGGCAASSGRVVGPTLKLPELTPEDLGMKEVPPGAVTYANRAWSSKPGMLLGLMNLVGALQSNLHLSKMTATKLVVVTSAINQCLY